MMHVIINLQDGGARGTVYICSLIKPPSASSMVTSRTYCIIVTPFFVCSVQFWLTIGFRSQKPFSTISNFTFRTS